MTQQTSPATLKASSADEEIFLGGEEETPPNDVEDIDDAYSVMPC